MAVVTAVFIEDNLIIRQFLIPALEELTPVKIIAVADTPAQGVALIEQYRENWQVLILDLFLKNGSGLSVLKACRKRGPHQRVFVLTNMATTHMRRTCLALGADRVFDKSTEMDEFIAHCKAI